MRQVTILLILLLIAASGAVEANSFRISLGYGKCGHNECKAASYCNKPNKASKQKKLVMVEKRLPCKPWAKTLGYPHKRYCTMFWDRYGRKFRRCYLYSQAFAGYPKDFCSRNHSYNQGHSLGYCKRGF